MKVFIIATIALGICGTIMHEVADRTDVIGAIRGDNVEAVTEIMDSM